LSTPQLEFVDLTGRVVGYQLIDERIDASTIAIGRPF
jgi:hypothetical protein